MYEDAYGASLVSVKSRTMRATRQLRLVPPRYRQSSNLNSYARIFEKPQQELSQPRTVRKTTTMFRTLAVDQQPLNP
jgi:hypothetical protein